MSVSNHLGWRQQGTADGWIGRYEQELIAFLNDEVAPLTEPVELAILFASLFLQAGHSCLPLDRPAQEWAKLLDLETGPAAPDFPEVGPAELQEYAAVGHPGDQALFILDGDRFYFKRVWYEEQYAAQKLKDLTSKRIEIEDPVQAAAALGRLFPKNSEEPDYQKTAAALALTRKFLLISGGPGTGKTTTIGRILTLLTGLSEKPLRIALTAPTGKAAVRMAEALQNEIEALSLPENQLEQIPKGAQTLHRLLWKYDDPSLLPPPRKKVLPYDLIIVDEASMIDLRLMVRLLRHLDDHTRLVMLGDRNQLASVGPGSVLGDICRKRENLFRSETASQLRQLGVEGALPVGNQGELADSILYLTKSYRFSETSGIGVLADAVNRSAADEIAEILSSGRYSDLTSEPFDFGSESFLGLFREMEERILACRNLPAEEMLGVWTRSAWLTVLRNGPFGSDAMNRLIEEYLLKHRVISPRQGWYTGRPVMVIRNDYTLGLYNGDIGVCKVSEEGVPMICFPGKGGESPRSIRAHRLTHYEPAFLFTVHKSQGSEFGDVTLLLPESDTPILTRELLYTAVTRARHRFRLMGDPKLLSTGAEREMARFTGLRSILYGAF